MPVLSALQTVIDAMTAAPQAAPTGTIAELRARAHTSIEMGVLPLMDQRPPLDNETDHRVRFDGGEITVRTYTPEGAGPFPAHLYIHGGGFWMGTLEHWDSVCRMLATGVDCVVASVDYRLSPEAKFPVPVEDCYTALRWLADHGSELRVDPSRISVGGTSSGGNFAAVVAMMARDRGGPPLAFQLLDIPLTDLTMSQPSVEEFASGPMITKQAIEGMVAHYLADPAHSRNPYVSPLLAPDLSGLPPALVMTAEVDPFRDEGEAYARRLAEAGVAVEHVRWHGHFHGSQVMAKVIPDEVAAYHDKMVEALRKAFGA